MIYRWFLVPVLAGAAIAMPAVLSAQQAKPKPQVAQRGQPPQDRFENEELTPGQIERAQEPVPQSTSPGQKAAPKKDAGSPPARTINCSGAFAKDSSHMKLAQTFNSQNIAFIEVDGPGGTKLMASVLYPKDPKRRLEVLWGNEAARMQTSLIVINGQSGWTAPKGLRLGLPLAALEKANGKPFKLKGFGDDGGNVSDWQAGALAALPGGCRVGVRLMPDPKAPADARAGVAGDREFASTDASIRAVKPIVAEIILGY